MENYGTQVTDRVNIVTHRKNNKYRRFHYDHFVLIVPIISLFIDILTNLVTGVD